MTHTGKLEWNLKKKTKTAKTKCDKWQQVIINLTPELKYYIGNLGSYESYNANYVWAFFFNFSTLF